MRQNAGTHYCWATVGSTGEPCRHRAIPGQNLPLCKKHLEGGDNAMKVVKHQNPKIGKVLVAGRDLPKGYRLVYWGQRVAWHKVKGVREDYSMTFLENGGVIDPVGLEGQQAMYMSCPGPGEVSNVKSTNECFGRARDDKLVGRVFETTMPVPKNTQLVQWYGAQWFNSRNMVRANSGTSKYPAPQRKPRTPKADTGSETVTASPPDQAAWQAATTGAEKTAPARKRAALGNRTNVVA